MLLGNIDMFMWRFSLAYQLRFEISSLATNYFTQRCYGREVSDMRTSKDVERRKKQRDKQDRKQNEKLRGWNFLLWKRRWGGMVWSCMRSTVGCWLVLRRKIFNNPCHSSNDCIFLNSSVSKENFSKRTRTFNKNNS